MILVGLSPRRAAHLSTCIWPAAVVSPARVGRRSSRRLACYPIVRVDGTCNRGQRDESAAGRWRPGRQTAIDGGHSGAALGVIVEHAELNLITLDPARRNESVSYIEIELRPLVESEPENLGMSLHTNSDLGVAVLEAS